MLASPNCLQTKSKLIFIWLEAFGWKVSLVRKLVRLLGVKWIFLSNNEASMFPHLQHTNCLVSPLFWLCKTSINMRQAGSTTFVNDKCICMQKAIKPSYFTLLGQIEREVYVLVFELLSSNLRRDRKASYLDLS